MTILDPTTLSPVIDRLLAEDDSDARDRVLLEAVQATGIADAAALWRPMSRGSEEPAWHPVLSRGDRALLPEPFQVEAVISGELAPDLPGRRSVLVAGSGPYRRALALGGVRSREEDLDRLEALLVVSATLETVCAPIHGDLDRVVAPLPSRPTARGARNEEARLRHDVRNHLASLRTTQELLRRSSDRLSAGERTHYRGLLEREIRRVRGLLIRIAGGSGATRGSGCRNPSEIVQDVVDSERAECRARGIEIELRVRADARAATCALDELSLTRVLRNLVVNARQALVTGGVSGGRISIELEAEPGALRLRVLDNGPGIASDHLTRVWDEGFTLGDHPGSGYGLCVVRELVESAGGDASVCNQLLGGACFEIRLPESASSL